MSRRAELAKALSFGIRGPARARFLRKDWEYLVAYARLLKRLNVLDHPRVFSKDGRTVRAKL